MINQDPEEALERFETVLMLEETRPVQLYSFNATKFIVLLASRLGQYEQMILMTEHLLRISNSVSKNEISEAINTILDCVKKRLLGETKHETQMYKLIL